MRQSCSPRRRRLFAEAFESDPKHAESMTAQYRYNAACSAALASAGRGDDNPPLGEPERRRWRKQALVWLRADLVHWIKQARSSLPQDEARAKQSLRHWKFDADLRAIRDEETLKTLSNEDRRACRSLWSEIDSLLLDRGDAIAHYNRGNALYQDKPQEAIAEFREAMRLDGDHVGLAPFQLGWRLCQLDRFEEALDLFRGLRERVRDDPPLLERVQTQLTAMERQAVMAARLPAMIRGDEKPKDSAEELAFADLAFFAKQFTASARMFGGAFRSDPKLAEDMTTFHRYNAACAAARAAASAEGDQARTK